MVNRRWDLSLAILAWFRLKAKRGAMAILLKVAAAPRRFLFVGLPF